VAFEAITTASPQIQGGKLRALAVTSAQPSLSLPGVPTANQTLPGYETISFLAIAAPPGMPRPIVNRLNAEVRRVLALPDVGQRFADWGGQPAPTSPEEAEAASPGSSSATSCRQLYALVDRGQVSQFWRGVSLPEKRTPSRNKPFSPAPP
jgi:hypothetical protein